MLALFAALVLTPLLYIPGYLITIAASGAAQPPDPLERHYERALLGALLNGWLALTLAELGIFSAWLYLAIILLVCIGCGLVGWRRGALRRPNIPLGIVAARSGAPLSTAALHRWIRANLEVLLFAGVGLLFALLVARPFEVVLGARDAGVYATTGFAIARNGGIVQYDQLLQQIDQDQHASDPQLRAAAEQAETNFLGTQPASRFIATRMRFAGYLVNEGDLSRGRVTSQFLHLYPAWIALLASLLGLRGGLLASGMLGFLGVWGVGLLGRRLAGPWVGLLGMLFLSLNGVQVWFSRYSTSEACAQFLSFAALYAFAVMQDAPQTTDHRPRTTDAKLASENINDAQSTILNSQFSILNSRSWFASLLAGLAAGQLALTRIDFFVVVAPLLAYLGYIALTKRWTRAHWALAGGLGAMLFHAALHIVFISRAYVLDTLYARLQDQSAIIAQIAYQLWTPALRQQFRDIPRAAPLRSPLRLALEIGLVAALVVALVLLRRNGRTQRWFERLVLRYRATLLWLGAALILLLGVYGYLIRPQILTAQRLAAVPGCIALGPARASQDCLALQGYVGAPIEPAKHPNPAAYALNVLPKLLRSTELPPIARSLPAATDANIRDVPGGGNVIGQIAAGDTLQLRAGSQADAALLVIALNGERGWIDSRQLSFDQQIPAALPRNDDPATDFHAGATSTLTATLTSAAALTDVPVGGAVHGNVASGSVVRILARSTTRLAYLATDPRGITGWLSPTALGATLKQLSALPEAAASTVANLANPRSATTFSFGNPGESEKIGIAQANLVRVGWYLSPLGVILGIIGFALWWRRGLNRASWLFLAASLISTIFFVRLSYGASDLTYIYILRRYMPLTYPAFSLGMAYAIVWIASCRPVLPFDTLRNRAVEGLQIADWKDANTRVQALISYLRLLAASGLVLVLVLFFVVTNRQLYEHVEYAGALDQLEMLAHDFAPGDVLLFRGEARDTPDLVTTPLKFAFGLDTFAIRSGDPGKYAVDLAHYVQHWQAQGRQVYLVLGANGAVELPGLRPVRVGPAVLRLPEFQQLRDQKPSLSQEFHLDFVIYRLELSSAAREAPRAIAADDYSVQVRGFYHTEQIDGATVAWTNGDALARLPWPRDNAPLTLTVALASGAARPAQLGPARACLSVRPEASFAFVDAPFAGEQCFELKGSGMVGYRYVIDPRGQPAPATGTFLLRIASPTWSPAKFDATQHDPRQLGVQFGGIAVGNQQ